MWKIFTSAGDIAELLKTIIDGCVKMVKFLMRKHEIKQVEKTSAEIHNAAENANKTGDVTDINKKFGF